MADTTALKNRIRAAIKANDNQEITGPVLQQTLLDIVDELDLNPELENEAQQRQNADTVLNNLITGIKNNIDNGYVYAGIAVPSTVPVSGKVFYIAVQAGTYTNFNNTAMTEGLTILKYNGTSWVKEQVLFTDGGVYDVTTHNSGATFASLSALLNSENLNTLIPTEIRHGGMSIKFVQSSDNKYIHYMYLGTEVTGNPNPFLDVTNWQNTSKEIRFKNLYDIDDPDNLSNKYYNILNVLVNSVGIGQSNYIAVQAGHTYTSQEYGVNILWYNSSKEFLSATPSSTYMANKVVVAPANAAYARFAYLLVNINKFFVCDINDDYTDKEYKEQVTNGKAQLFNLNKFKSNITKRKNLFSISDEMLFGQYYNRSNILTSSENLSQIKIPVEDRYYYYPSETNTFTLWYDANMTFLGATDALSILSRDYAVPISGSKYARFIFLTENINNSYIYSNNEDDILIKDISVEEEKPYKNKIGVAFGTSLTYRALTTGGYLTHLQTLLDCHFYNKGLGSSTILPVTGIPQMLPVIKGYTNYANVDIVILEGFVNDWYINGASLGAWTDDNETTVCGCVRSAINYMLSQNPNLTVFLVLDHYGQGITASTAVNSANKTQFEFYEEIAKVGESLGIPVIKEYAISQINENTPQYLMDNIHPTELGAKQSANAIWSQIRNFLPNEVI